jgi:hypothetical protein
MKLLLSNVALRRAGMVSSHREKSQQTLRWNFESNAHGLIALRLGSLSPAAHTHDDTTTHANKRSRRYRGAREHLLSAITNYHHYHSLRDPLRH